ncbi:MAG: hypothetical protein Q7S98_04270 [Deltaproteobacteria bacterium]|nr:hypothetical protein [Deltaproteobacteria bacterium]
MRNGPFQESGFSFIEAILVTVVIGFGLVGLMTVTSNVFTTSLQTDQSTRAVYLASEKLEQLIAQRELSGYNSINVGTTNENPVVGFVNFNRITIISRVALSGNSFIPSANDVGYKQIQVSVTGSGQAIQLQTIVTDWVPL